MLIWNGYTIEEVADEVAAEMIKKGSAVEVGPYDGLRQFPTKDEMATYATKDMQAKRRAKKGDEQ